MKPIDARLELRISQQEKAEWKALAKQHGMSTSHLVRRVMRQITGSNPVQLDDSLLEPSTKIMIRLNRSEERAIRKAATAAGLENRQAWIVALIRANLFNLPTPSYRELEALREANKQLRGVGINLNQIAHAVNIDLEHIDRLTGKTLEQLRYEVKKEKDAVAAVVQQTLYRWTKRKVEDDA